MKPLRRPRSERFNFTMFFAGRTVSVLMSSVYTFAVGLYVLKLTGSGLSFAVTLALQIAPTVLLGPVAGVLADRYNKKVMAVSADAFSGCIFLALFLCSGGGLSVPAVYAATLLLSCAQVLYDICVDSAVPDIVSTKNVLPLNSAGKIVDSAAAIISPALGGILYAAVDIRLFVLLNGISFLFSTAAECLIDFRLFRAPDVAQPVSGGQPEPGRQFLPGFRDGVAQGVRYIRQTAWIRSALFHFLMINFFLALCYSVPVPYLLNNVFRLPPAVYGAVQCFLPAGTILGALLVKKVSRALAYEKMIFMMEIFGASCLMLLGLPPVFGPGRVGAAAVPYYSALMAFFGMVCSLIDIPFINSFQTRVPEEIRGRSLSISISAVKIFSPVGYLLAGVLLKSAPAYSLPLYGGAAMLVLALTIRRKSAPPGGIK